MTRYISETGFRKEAEIAERLNMSEPTVRKRYERAKKKMAEQLCLTESEDFK